jgi:hypothetical protein
VAQLCEKAADGSSAATVNAWSQANAMHIRLQDSGPAKFPTGSRDLIVS